MATYRFHQFTAPSFVQPQRPVPPSQPGQGPMGVPGGTPPSSWTGQPTILPTQPALVFNGTGLLAQLGLDCNSWLALSNAERTRRLLVTFWGGAFAGGNTYISWTLADQQRLQAMINAIEAGCAMLIRSMTIAQTKPAGQTMAVLGQSAFPLSATYWLSKTGLSVGQWCGLGYYDKLNALNLALSYGGQGLGGTAMPALMSAIDAYCGGLSFSAPFLSPYQYPYAPYGYGYQLPYAFPFIVRTSGFRFPGGPVPGPFPGGGGRPGGGGGGGGGGGRPGGGSPPPRSAGQAIFGQPMVIGYDPLTGLGMVPAFRVV